MPSLVIFKSFLLPDAYDTDDVDIDWQDQNAVQIGEIEMPQFTLCNDVSLTDYTENCISKYCNTVFCFQMDRQEHSVEIKHTVESS